MIQINQIKLPIDHKAGELEAKIRKTLRLSPKDFLHYTVQKRSIDARKKPELYYIYSVYAEVKKEEQLLKKAGSPNVKRIVPEVYALPACGEQKLRQRPVVIGAGPAGLFCALTLTEAGYHPLVIERGKPVEERKRDVEEFWRTGILDPSSNVQFGEGGAGTFSDGKLNTVVKDVGGRNRFVLETFVRFGAHPDILIDAKPHIGTDVLAEVIRNLRLYLQEKGCEFLFDTAVKDFVFTGKQLKELICPGRRIPAQVGVLAIGHSARDTFVRLNELELPMAVKNFAVGFRVEHPQSMIDEAMYGIQKNAKLPASPYKVTSNFPNGRGVYSFCMCPGGYVVNSSSEEERTVVNGMSYSGRNASNANSAIIVSVTEQDFGASDPLAGMRYQQRIEHEVWKLGGGKIPQQLFGDFREKRATGSYGAFTSCTKGETVFAPLNGLLSSDMEESFILGMDHFSRIVKDFNRYDAIMSGMETRTSSPIRIHRNEEMESEYAGIYPCGEGAGYAGGITSAAVDGLRVAEAIIKKYRPDYA